MPRKKDFFAPGRMASGHVPPARKAHTHAHTHNSNLSIMHDDSYMPSSPLGSISPDISLPAIEVIVDLHVEWNERRVMFIQTYLNTAVIGVPIHPFTLHHNVEPL